VASKNAIPKRHLDPNAGASQTGGAHHPLKPNPAIKKSGRGLPAQ